MSETDAMALFFMLIILHMWIFYGLIVQQIKNIKR